MNRYHYTIEARHGLDYDLFVDYGDSFEEVLQEIGFNYNYECGQYVGVADDGWHTTGQVAQLLQVDEDIEREDEQWTEEQQKVSC